MVSQPIFAVPIGTRRQSSVQLKTLKRKRSDRIVATAGFAQWSDVHNDRPPSHHSIEYSAVVTPTERSQKRLAGWPLNQDPPPYPFPHAQLVCQYKGYNANAFTQKAVKSQHTSEDNAQQDPSQQSLHYQHLSAMTAVLHKSMMAKDWSRARRALGLLLRNEVRGHIIDIRNEGLWEVGAEILLRQGDPNCTEDADGDHIQKDISRPGFECAKLFYERLMVQYPAHKSWPDAVNALDFSTALFGLWVYVVNCEILQMRRSSSNEEIHLISSPGTRGLNLSDINSWELDQAKQIAEAMDKRMGNTSFADNPEMLRLRAMIALWVADLLDVCSELEQAALENRQGETLSSINAHDYIDSTTSAIERAVVSLYPVGFTASDSEEAANNRRFAEELFSRLSKHDTLSRVTS